MIKFLKGLCSWFPFLGLCAKHSDMTSLDRDTANDYDESVPEIWENGVTEDSYKSAFFGDADMGSAGSGKPIVKKDDFTRYKHGDVIHIQTISKLFGAGQTGENQLIGNEEKNATATYSFTVSRKRHAVALTEEVEREVNFDALDLAGRQLADWEAVRRDDMIFNELINGSASPRNLYGGTATSVDALAAGCQLGTNEIDKTKLVLSRLGAQPIDTPFGYAYALVIDELSEYELKGDNRWNNANYYAAPRSYTENALWQGRMGKAGRMVGIWNGVAVYVLNSVRSGAVIMGSYVRPEAVLTSNYTAGGVTLTVAASSAINATKYFPSTGKVTLYDGTNREEVAYSATSANTITITAAANSFASGSLVTYYDSVSRCVAYGADAVACGYGQTPRMITDTRDYGMINGVGISVVDGAKLIEDSANAVPNCVILNVKAENPTTI